jgi:hypothetical protein
MVMMSMMMPLLEVWRMYHTPFINLSLSTRQLWAMRGIVRFSSWKHLGYHQKAFIAGVELIYAVMRTQASQ